MKELFNSDQSKVVLSKFKTKIDSLTPEDGFEMGRNNLISLVIGAMASNPEQWDEQCQINIESIGDRFINRLSDAGRELDKERLDDVCSSCFRFFFELYLSMDTDLASEFEEARDFVFDNLEAFENLAKKQIEFALRGLPIRILKQLMNSDAIKSLKDFNAISANAEKLKEEWNQEISDKQSEVEKLKDALNEYKDAFNFVGLYDGFNELAKEKKKELDGLLRWLRILSGLVIAPAIMSGLGVIYFSIKNLDLIQDGLLVSLLPALSLTGIFIYYFRVLLFNYKSVKSQLLQIDLRKTLCQFIQSYATYSQEIKSKDNEALSKFENIIFSGIVTEEGNLPSTYDGLEQIAKLIKSTKS